MEFSATMELLGIQVQQVHRTVTVALVVPAAMVAWEALGGLAVTQGMVVQAVPQPTEWQARVALVVMVALVARVGMEALEAQVALEEQQPPA